MCANTKTRPRVASRSMLHERLSSIATSRAWVSQQLLARRDGIREVRTDGFRPLGIDCADRRHCIPPEKRSGLRPSCA